MHAAKGDSTPAAPCPYLERILNLNAISEASRPMLGVIVGAGFAQRQLRLLTVKQSNP
jgi:hypothetical protein